MRLNIPLFLLAFILSFNNCFSISYSWLGTINSDWATPTNWSPNGIPGPGDDVTIGFSINPCQLDANRTIDGMVINSGTLNLGSFTLELVALNSSYNGGTISDGTLFFNAPLNTITLGNTTFNVNLNINAERILLNGGNYNNPCVFHQVGTTNSSGTGNAQFASTLDFTLSGSGYFRTNGNIFFQNDVTITNNGSNYVMFERLNGSFYTGNLTLINNSTSNIRVAYDGNTFFNGNIQVANNGGGNILFGERTTATASLLDGFTISVHALDFTNGLLRLNRFTQLGSTPQNLVLNGTARLFLQETVFNGDLNIQTPNISITENTFNGITSIEKLGEGNDNCVGDNTFNASTTIINSSNSNFLLANGLTNPDIFNADVLFSNRANGRLRVAQRAPGNEFNGNVFVENLSNLGIEIGQGGGTSTLNIGNTFNIGGLGFDLGELDIRGLNQIDAATAQNITLTGTAILYLQNTQWEANLTGISPRILIRENTFNGVTTFEKNGTTNDASVGDNVFNNNATFINTSDARMILANGATNPDIFNSDVIFSNQGDGFIWASNRAVGNQYNGNVIVENTIGGTVNFGRQGGTSVLNVGGTFNVGGLGFSIGDLDIRNVNQNDAATAQNIVLTGDARLLLYDNIWEGNFDGVSPGIIINGNTFNGSTTLEKNGIANNNSNGGNTFNGITQITNSSDGIFRLSFGVATPDIFNGDVSISNLSNGQMIMSSRALGNQYNQNIIVESTSPNGVTFGVNGGTSTLNAGGVINIGGLGFATGDLRFQNFTQTDVATPQNITLTANARLYLYDSEWTASVNFIAPRLYSRTSIFNSATYLEKNGVTNESSFGGNIYNDVVEIVTNGTGYWRTGNNEGNTFNADVTYSQLNTGVNRPAFGTASFYLANINLNAPTSFIYLASGNGYVEFTGNGNQTINNIGSAQNHRFRRLTTNKTGGSLTLNTPTEIVTELNLQQGNITSSLANLLIMRDNAIVSNVSNNAYVEGPVRKIGNDVFTFPTGKNGFYRPCGISAPTSTAHHFTAEYFNDNPDLVHDATLFDPSLEYISECEYWEINRTNGASNVNVFLSWDGYDAPTCSGVENLSNLMVSRLDGAQWNNSGNGGTTGTSFSGSISTNAAQTSFGYYTLATLESINNLGRNVINSIADGDWSNTSTWDCTCIPNSPENIVNIRDNHNVTLDGDFITGSLYINELGSLNLLSNELSISQNFSILGGLNENNGTLNFNGTLGDQYIRGISQTQSLNDVTVNNNSGAVSIYDITMELNGLLDVSQGDFNATNGTFIVNSTSDTENGNIAPLTAGSITGAITVRRFIPGGNADYRNISSPLANIPLIQWDDDFYMSGPGFPDGCAYGPDGCFRSVKYIENDDYFDVDEINHTLVSGRGYDVFLGDNLNVFSGTVVDVTGNVNVGDISRNFTGGWSLIGNPFASNVDFNLFNRPFTMGNYFYVYDSNTGNYQWYNGQDNSSGNGLGGPGDINNGIIGLGQGVWVFGSGNLTIPQSSKVRTPAMYIKNASVPNGFSIVLTSDVNSYSCDATFSFDASADNALDIMDITHLKSRNESAPYISSVVSNKNVRLNKFNNNENTLIFPLNVYVTENETYTITVNDIHNFSAYSCVYLIDSITGLQYDLKEINSFTFEPNDIEEEETRFVLVMSNSNCDMIEDISLTNSSLEFEDMIAITQRNQQIDIDFDLIKNQNVSVQVFNSLGKMIHNEVLSNIKSTLHTIDISGNATGIYSIRVVSNSGQKTKQIFLSK